MEIFTSSLFKSCTCCAVLFPDHPVAKFFSLNFQANPSFSFGPVSYRLGRTIGGSKNCDQGGQLRQKLTFCWNMSIHYFSTLASGTTNYWTATCREKTCSSAQILRLGHLWPESSGRSTPLGSSVGCPRGDQ